MTMFLRDLRDGVDDVAAEALDWANMVNPAAFETWPEYDCEHGCNGDCRESGSDRCSFTCHGLESAS